jgi:hypothetical protein
MKKMFLIKNYGLSFHKFPHLRISSAAIGSRKRSSSLLKIQSAFFVEQSIFSRLLNLRRKIEGDVNISNEKWGRILNKKDLEEAESIFQTILESKDKTKIQEIVPEVKNCLYLLAKNKHYSNKITNIVLGIFKELQGQDFPFFLVPDYLQYLFTFEKKSATYFPQNFVSDFEKFFYEKAMMLKIKELSYLFELNRILKNQFSSNFLPFLEKIILLNINDEKFLYLKSCEMIMSELRKNALFYASNKFLDEYLTVYLNILTNISINHKELNYVLKCLHKKLKINYYDFEVREILTKFFQGSREIFQSLIEDESFYDKELFISILMLGKNNWINQILSKNFYNSIIDKIITREVNRTTIIILLSCVNEIHGISIPNVEKIDLSLIHLLNSIKDLRDFYLIFKWGKKHNNHLIIDITFLQLAKVLLEKGEIEHQFINSLQNFRQNYKHINSINRFSLTVFDLFVKKHPSRKIVEKEEKLEQDIDEAVNV